jgi:hypothetical protein
MEIADKMSDIYYFTFVFKKIRSLYIPVKVGYREAQRIQEKYDQTRILLLFSRNCLAAGVVFVCLDS